MRGFVLVLVAATRLWAQAGAVDNAVGHALKPLAPAKPKPVTRHEFWHAYMMDTIGPVPFLREGIAAAASQSINSPHEWGQGWGAYGERFGSDMAYNAVRMTLQYSMAAALHEDNRYFGSGQTRFWPRLKYALESPARARRPDGSYRVSISSLTAIGGAVAISRSWVPESWESPGVDARAVALTYAGSAGINVFREFVPDILRKLHHKP